MTYFRPTAVRFFLLVIFVSASGLGAAAQSAKPPEDRTLQALLNEVRLLRETLQRLNLNAYRSQIIVERIRAQNDRVTRLTRALEDTREEIANLQANLQQLSERAKGLEAQIQQEADTNKRAQLEAMEKEFKFALEQGKQRLERLREREMRLTNELQEEQGKLHDLEARLEAMEREIENEIERQRSTGKEKEQRE
ncbi:MAG TPA: hypothetical protein VNO70_14970 [Blastocatellia bacterium]|nr:hypothetical protein [Blastocatellia bacterium]